MNMNAVDLLLLMGSAENNPPPPPVGDVFWIDSTRPNANKIITNNGDFIVFNPGT